MTVEDSGEQGGLWWRVETAAAQDAGWLSGDSGPIMRREWWVEEEEKEETDLAQMMNQKEGKTIKTSQSRGEGHGHGKTSGATNNRRGRGEGSVPGVARAPEVDAFATSKPPMLAGAAAIASIRFTGASTATGDVGGSGSGSGSLASGVRGVGRGLSLRAIHALSRGAGGIRSRWTDTACLQYRSTWVGWFCRHANSVDLCGCIGDEWPGEARDREVWWGTGEEEEAMLLLRRMGGMHGHMGMSGTLAGEDKEEEPGPDRPLLASPLLPD